MNRSFAPQFTVGYLYLGKLAVVLYWLTLPLILFYPVAWAWRAYKH